MATNNALKNYFEVKVAEGRLWQVCEDITGPYDAELNNFSTIDKAANGAMFALAVKEKPSSRKFKLTSQKTRSVTAHIPSVKELLKTNYLVKVFTPDLEIIFFKD